MPNPLSAPQDIDLDPEPAAVQDIELAVPEREPALPFRSDTILGVCEALGQDFGFNPTYLRIALASLVLWNSFPAPKPFGSPPRSSTRPLPRTPTRSPWPSPPNPPLGLNLRLRKPKAA